MQMPPPPPTSSSSTDSGYLGIPAMSSRLKALEEKILRQIGPVDTGTTNRTTSRNLNIQTRQIPSSKKKNFFLLFSSFFLFLASLNSPSLSRASSAPPTRKGVFHLPLSPLQPTPTNTRLKRKSFFFNFIFFF
jgi:hypothetical protein